MDERIKLIRKIHKEHGLFYRVTGGVLLVLLGVVLGQVFFSGTAVREDYVLNLYTELLSIVATVFIINFFVRLRDEQTRLRLEKERLLRQVRMPSSTATRHALHELRELGWLTGEDGLLAGQSLSGVNLRRGNLIGANLTATDLWGANLRRANLENALLNNASLLGVDLRGAKLVSAKLEGAKLDGAKLNKAVMWSARMPNTSLQRAVLEGAKLGRANLSGANLAYADLREANLRAADLRGARLLFAKLDNADLRGAVFDETTILPDGKPWRADVNLKERYKAIVSDPQKDSDDSPALMQWA